MIKDKKVNIISAIVFFILGIIIFLNPEVVIKFISYCLGGLLILIGIYKCVNYYIQDKRLGIVNRYEMAFGITAIVLGIVFIFLADAIELLLRFIIGGWVVLSGIGKIFSTFYTTERNSKFYSMLVIGIILIAIGLYIILVSNLALSIIGLFMMLYGVVDFVSYFVYKDRNTNQQIIHKTVVVNDAVVEEKENIEEDKID